MRKILYSLVLLSFVAAWSFGQNCQNPVSNNVFQGQFNQVAAQQTNQKKLDKAVEFFNANCYMSQQVKNVALLFTEDSYRLDFCKAAYPHTFDQVNFYDVYDAFTAFSFAFRLHDFVKPGSKIGIPVSNVSVTQVNPTNTNTANTNTTTPANIKPLEPSFPSFTYPDVTKYNGVKGCTGPVINDQAFKLIAKTIFTMQSDEAKLSEIKTVAEKQCLSFAQLMKLGSLLSTEDSKFQMLVITFARAYDKENYPFANALLPTPQLQNEWTTFAKGQLTPSCSVSDDQFNSINNSIKAKPFSADKLNILNGEYKDRCFTVAQITTLSKQFTFGAEKLKVFKSLYAKCADQNNYYRLVDELTFTAEKDNLSNFIKNGGK